MTITVADKYFSSYIDGPNYCYNLSLGGRRLTRMTATATVLPMSARWQAPAARQWPARTLLSNWLLWVPRFLESLVATQPMTAQMTSSIRPLWRTWSLAEPPTMVKTGTA